eukprot:553969-Pyramimonas_sp.AAC.1
MKHCRRPGTACNARDAGKTMGRSVYSARAWRASTRQSSTALVGDATVATLTTAATWHPRARLPWQIAHFVQGLQCGAASATCLTTSPWDCVRHI